MVDTRGQRVWVHSDFDMVLDAERPRHLERVIYKGGYEYLGTGDTDSSDGESGWEDSDSDSGGSSAESDTDSEGRFDRHMAAERARWADLCSLEEETENPGIAAWYYVCG